MRKDLTYSPIAHFHSLQSSESSFLYFFLFPCIILSISNLKIINGTGRSFKQLILWFTALSRQFLANTISKIVKSSERVVKQRIFNRAREKHLRNILTSVL